MIELKPSDIRSPAQLKALGVSADEIGRYVINSQKYTVLSSELAKANQAQDWNAVLDLEPEIDKIAKHLKYLGRHPKSIPIAELQELPRNSAEDTTEAQFRDRITNPASAVRAFCVMCMGGNVTYVRDCEAVGCPLWPFRTGKNPLFGKVLPPVDFDATIDPTEPPEEDAEDESDNQDAD